MKTLPSLPSPPPAFARRKARVLELLARPEAEYSDASPKGSVDVGIRDLIAEINAVEGFVTTSSCAGRVSVFLEGSKRAAAAVDGEGSDGKGVVRGENGMDEENPGEEGRGRTAVSGKLAGVGGKGGGGAWLFVSHDPVPVAGEGEEGDVEVLLGLRKGREKGSKAVQVIEDDVVPDIAATRLVHFKFEPMILHVLTASPEHAQLLLRCGSQAGFRESGAVNVTPAAGEQHATPIVAIRSMGLMFESLIGYQRGDSGSEAGIQCTVSPSYLRTLIHIANERFAENRKRIERFQAALAEATRPVNDGKGEWEDADARRERKRAEGLRRKEELRRQKESGDAAVVEDETLDVPLNVDLT